jgi:hypothetical protein
MFIKVCCNFAYLVSLYPYNISSIRKFQYHLCIRARKIFFSFFPCPVILDTEKKRWIPYELRSNALLISTLVAISTVDILSAPVSGLIPPGHHHSFKTSYAQ